MKSMTTLCPSIAATPLGRDLATSFVAHFTAAGVADGRAVLSDPGDT